MVEASLKSHIAEGAGGGGWTCTYNLLEMDHLSFHTKPYQHEFIIEEVKHDSTLIPDHIL